MTASAPSIGTNRSKLHHQPQLLRLRWWPELDSPPVADSLAAREIPHLVADRGRLGSRQIGPPAVQALVARQLLRPLAGEALEEVLARPGLEIEDARPDPASP